MRIRRLIRRVGVFLCATALAGGVLYALSIRIPSHYKPLRLSAQGRDDGMHRFVNYIGRFCSQAGKGKKFTWTLTAAQANEYLASIDAIAALSGEQAYPSARMAEAGFEDPALAMRDGVLTVAVRSTRHNRILSLDLRFEFDQVLVLKKPGLDISRSHRNKSATLGRYAIRDVRVPDGPKTQTAAALLCAALFGTAALFRRGRRLPVT